LRRQDSTKRSFAKKVAGNGEILRNVPKNSSSSHDHQRNVSKNGRQATKFREMSQKIVVKPRNSAKCRKKRSPSREILQNVAKNRRRATKFHEMSQIVRRQAAKFHKMSQKIVAKSRLSLNIAEYKFAN
jgi:hypothetical protein